MTPEHQAWHDPIAILAGLGLADRAALATLLALFQQAGSAALVKAAAKGLWGKITVRSGQQVVGDSDAGAALVAAKATIFGSAATDEELRHRLWLDLVTALNVKGATPFSPRSARQSASALAVRVSEHLSPGIRKARETAMAEIERAARPAGASPDVPDWLSNLGQEASQRFTQAKAVFVHQAPLPFTDIVTEEFLSILRNPEVAKAVEEAALQDGQMAAGFRQAHLAAQTAMVGAGGWLAFAAIVANTGFAPYMLAAQASAWLPFVGGQTLVSLLAVLVNPVTLVAGIGALTWLGAAKSGDIARAAIASRIAILLAMSAGEDTDSGLAEFLDSMRSLTLRPEAEMAHLSTADRRAFRDHAAFVLGRLGNTFGAVAGVPPAPWNQRALSPDMKLDLSEAATAATLTAAEIYWHAAAIDPNVIVAADFSRSANLGDPLSFAWSAHDFASAGAGYSLRGYTAERLVRDHFVALGHAVTMDPLSNTAGLDLMLDGLPVQVKCGDNLSLLATHFDKYPDIPVIANLELADKAWASGADWANKVTTFPGFEVARIEADVSEALGHAASILDPGVFEIALHLGLLRGGLAVWRGQIPLDDLPVWLVMNAGARGALVFGGGKLGWLAGLVAAGPAGAIIIGPAVACAALIGVRPLQGLATQAMMGDWHRELVALAATLHGELVIAVDRRITELTRRSEQVRARSQAINNTFSSWLVRRADDDLIFAVEEQANLGTAPLKEADIPTLLAKAALLAPGAMHVVVARKAVEDHLRARPELTAAAMGVAKDLMGRVGVRG